MIDINQPVEQGHDMILNYDDGRQELGNAEYFESKASKGQLIGTPDPASNLNREDEGEDVPVRKANGRFSKK